MASAILKGLSGDDYTVEEVDSDFYVNLSKKVKANLPNFGTLPISALSEDQINRYASGSLIRTLEAAEYLSRDDLRSLNYYIAEGKKDVARFENDPELKPGGRNDSSHNRSALPHIKKELKRNEDLKATVGSDKDSYFTALVLLALRQKVSDMDEEESHRNKFNSAPAIDSPDYPLYAFRMQPLWDKKEIIHREIETAKDLLKVEVPAEYLDKIFEIKGEEIIDRIAYPQKIGHISEVQYVPGFEYEQTTSPDVQSRVHIRVPGN